MSKASRLDVCLLAIAVGVAFASSASAGTMTLYTSEADYLAATTGNTRVEYEDVTPDGTALFLIPPDQYSVTRNGVTVANSLGVFCYHNVFQWEGSGLAMLRSDSSANTDVTFAAPHSEVAVEFYPAIMPPSTGAVHGLITLSDSTTQEFEFAATNSTTLDFLGVVSTTPGVTVQKITAYPDSTGYTAPGILAVHYGQTIPEPATSVLLAAGLFGLLAYAWRKRR